MNGFNLCEQLVSTGMYERKKIHINAKNDILNTVKNRERERER
jgi:hypothetical protein